MKKFCQRILLGMLLSSGISLMPMAQALEELEKRSQETPPLTFPGQTPLPKTSEPVSPVAAKMAAVPHPIIQEEEPKSLPAKMSAPPQATAPVMPTAVMPHALPDEEPDDISHVDHATEEHPSLSNDTASKSKATLQVVDVESFGLDTINIDSGGNWLEKRIWFKKAEILFDQIRKSVEQAADLRIEFVDAVNAVGKKIDNFYDVVSYDKGQLDELLKQAAHKVSDASERRGGDLSDDERNLHLSIQTEQKQIVQIGDDIKKIEDFDMQIDKTMSQAFKTIDMCRSLENKAWEDFKSIGSELDDKKARILYYEMDNAQKNIEQQIDYLKDTLLPYMQNKLVASSDNIMTTILNAVKELETKGIHLKALLNTEEQKDLNVEKEREIEQEKSAEAAWEKEELVQKTEDQQEAQTASKKNSKNKQKNQETAWYENFFTSIVDRLQSLGCFLLNFARSVSCKFFELAPKFFESIGQYFQIFWNYIVTSYAILSCYVSCIVCLIKSWLCGFFGK